MKVKNKTVLVCSLLLCGHAYATTILDLPRVMVANNNNAKFHIELLYLKPKSNNLKYAVFVSGHQPLFQSWHNQEIDPDFQPAFEIGLSYAFPHSAYDFSADWLHLKTHDSDSKQASRNTDVATVQFVAPFYDVGPAVFGIKKGASTVKFDFDSIELNVGKTFAYTPCVQARVFGGINLLRINQTLTTTFSDYAGSPPTSLTYGLPPDPHFNFQTKNTSTYLGAGPDLGINVEYKGSQGLGLVGQFLGTLTAGSISVNDGFTSKSDRLRLLGYSSTHQEITAPDSTQIVPGFDAKLGVLYNWSKANCFSLTLEAGYRIAYYIDAISDVSPATLVQAGFSVPTPEFATGTMAINSTGTRDRPFGFQGPYLNLEFALPA